MYPFLVATMVAAVLVGLVLLRRRRSERRRSAARTVELHVDADRVRRLLGDGRTESARWSQVESVEVVCTPVRTADGADAFVLVSENSPEHEPVGCLVPLGVGYDEVLIHRLARLQRFDLAEWSRAIAQRPPRRTVVWRRENQPGGTTTGGEVAGMGND